MAILRANGSFLKANGKILVRPENKIDPDIVILQDWVTQDVGLQPTGGIPASLSARFDPDGPLDVSGTGWSGTPYVSAQAVNIIQIFRYTPPTSIVMNKASRLTNFIRKTLILLSRHGCVMRHLVTI